MLMFRVESERPDRSINPEKESVRHNLAQFLTFKYLSRNILPSIISQ